MRLDTVLADLHQHTRDAVIVTETNDLAHPGPRVVFVNRAFEQMTGYSADEIIGRTPRMLQGPDTCRKTLTRIRSALVRREQIQEEVLNYRKDGTPYWNEISIIPVFDDAGQPQYFVSVQRDVSRRKRIEAALVEQRDNYWRTSLLDDLTGLLNRRGLKDCASACCAADAAPTITLFAIDLDRFKQLNDTLGHDAGDRVLCCVADRMSAAARPGELVARMGGDEFMLLDTAARTEDLLQRAQFIQNALSLPVTYGQTPIPCHASVGAATGTWDDYASGALFRRADLALYSAKLHGRGQVALFKPDMERRFFERATLAADLQFALEQGGFSVAYMPKVCAKTFAVIGLEALARWHHPVHGSVPPDVFIALAEELKIVEQIDAFVLRQVAADRRSFDATGTTLPPISVNVSTRRLNDSRLLADIELLGLRGKDVSVELIETVLLDRMDDRITATLDALRERDISIEIDDFGSGHASILALTQIRPHWLKLDKRFACDITHDKNTQSVVRAALSMAQALDTKVIAEGVETQAQAALLASMGCTALQGFLFGRPGSLAAAMHPKHTTVPARLG